MFGLNFLSHLINSINFTTSTILILASILFWSLMQKTSKHKLPPGPRGLPMFGNLLQMYNQDILQLFASYRKQYGDIFLVKTGSCRIIVVNRYDAIKEVFLRRADEFSNRPNNFLIKHLMENSGIGASNGSHWKEQRSFGTKTMRHFGVGKKNIEIPIQEECEQLIERIQQENGAEFDIRHLLQNAAANVICAIAFGLRYDYGDPKFIELAKYVDQLTRSVGSTGVFNAFPFLQHFPVDLLGQKKLQSIFKKFLDYLSELVEKHKASLVPNEPRDLIDFYLIEMENDKNKTTTFDDKNLLHLLLDLFVGGIETTATTISWAIAYLLHNPSVQQKLHNEIDNVLGSKVPTMADKKAMHYMSAFLEEIQRIATIAPFAFEHAPCQETSLFGCTIPIDAVLIPNLHSVSFDPHVFPDPFKFSPERFIDEKGCFAPNEKNIPFSIGPRKCVGEALAKSELFLFMTSLVQRFQFVPGEDGLPVLSGSLGVSYAIVPYKLKAIPRK